MWLAFLSALFNVMLPLPAGELTAFYKQGLTPFFPFLTIILPMALKTD